VREVLSSVNPIPGVVVTSIGAATSDWAEASFLQADGKIVVAGGTIGQNKNHSSYENFAVLRYGADGVLDPGFGKGGVVTTQFQRLPYPSVAAFSHASSVAPDPSGRIVAAGGVQFGTDVASNNFALARYNSNGSLDNTFNYQPPPKKSGSATYGTVQTDLGGDDGIVGVVFQAGGKIVAVGSSNATGTLRFTLARYTAAGQLDSSFGAGGIANPSLGRPAYLEDVTTHQGKPLAVGHVIDPGGDDFALARYTDNGSLDTSFGDVDPNNPLLRTGTVISNRPGDDLAHAVAVYPSGGAYQDCIVVAGEVQNTFAVARYQPDGSLDPAFGSGGLVQTLNAFAAYSVAIQPDGKIVAAGLDGLPSGGYGFFIARYDTSGNVDPSFGAGTGMVTTAIPSLNASANSVLIQSDGKIVVTGRGEDGAQRDFIVLARYNLDGSLDGNFGVSGAGGAIAPSSAALTDAALADAGRQQLALAALVQYEDQLQSRPAARSKGWEVPAIDLALAELALQY